ncbi:MULTISPECIES: aminotransferase class I/II-fold pyridoxal phosphate-dependent enzyme [Myxococcus]|uniref:aminotransferase class I/II-fold pyridoxal phosphate-dependent enzyme n=1 Tax=Myxococcus TaxID=32 RepID=UPI00112CD11E|nr:MULTISPECIES: aminotransferase class I/II-fold pyridoxal phosphate-dependent enzyme [Myxococcus]NOK00792.1 aminotransferase class I/II-fold pyridoxal phosphate-dependent enzyme [Myxococcus xanthus]QDE88305.1 cystathionine gamma-synthase [Myxococcus xanthus]QQR45446.1 aminotransferase class I/II-fold pyridoxal phosphate-dependent enzyme [Myxococcus xanthus]
MKLATALVHAGVRRDPTTGAVAVPIYQSATFQHPALGQSTGYDYSRTRNPTRSALEDALAQLEGGSRGLAFSSGMAALHCALQLFGPEDHVLLTEDLYGGTYRLVDRILHVPCTFVDTSRPSAVRDALRPNTRAIVVETPTNPMMRTADLSELAAIARKAGVLLIVDNTFLTPWLQRPLELGADIVVHSATKYLAGHNDVVAGALVVKDAALGERLAYLQNGIGAILGPQDAYLVIRGLKTLALRMERHQANAREVAAWLRAHPGVERVFYPGVGGMLSFTVAHAALVPQVLASVQLCLFAESLGGVETLITYPTTQTHADIPAERREALGISDRLLRLSVGIEDSHDIIADLAHALRDPSAAHGA